MFMKQLYPDEVTASIYDLDWELLSEKYEGVIFDIDNTLVPHGAPADERSIEFFRELKHIGFAMILLSNNKEPRVKMFGGAVGAQYIFKGGKPKRAGYLRGMEMMGTDRKTTLFVGDQLFTDVWGAKNAGIYSILVKQIDKKEEIQIVLKRYLEKIVLASYKRDCIKRGKEYLVF